MTTTTIKMPPAGDRPRFKVLLTSEDILIGEAVIEAAPDYAYLWGLKIEKDFRSHSCRFLEEIRSRFPKLYIYVKMDNQKAIAFYEKQGLKRVLQTENTTIYTNYDTEGSILMGVI